MSRILVTCFAFSFAAAGVGCADFEDDAGDDPSVAELGEGLTPVGKADSAGSGISVRGNRIALRQASSRTLYNMLDQAGAYARTGNGLRALYARGVACITNGLNTYCELRGRSESGDGSYEAILHGRLGRSAASTLYYLLGGNESFVSTPWFACERSGRSVWCGVETSERVTLDFDGLDDSGDDFVYEGWAISGGMPTTTDRFRNGPQVHQRVPSSIAADALYVLTIEPRRGDVPAPSATHLLAGSLDLGSATDLGTGHPAALNTDFADAAGGYILATPTSADTSDETNGIWFVDPAAGAASLDLPTLPEGWVYEGWVVGANGPVSTGRFTELAGVDSDGAGPAAGSGMAPPFPGQDFVAPAMDLLGATVVISVEPEPDNSPAPFAIKPLIDGTVDDIGAPNLQDLGNTHDKRPSATASFGL